MFFQKKTKWIPLYNYVVDPFNAAPKDMLVQMRRNIQTGLIEFKTTKISESKGYVLGIDPVVQFQIINEVK